MRSAVYLLVFLISLPAFSADAVLAYNNPDVLIHEIDAAKKLPLMELPFTISDLYLAAEKITEHPECRSHNGLNDVFACLWQKLGNGAQMPETPLAIANALLDNLRAEQVILKAEADKRKAEEAELALSAPISSFHDELCIKGDEFLGQLNKQPLEKLSAGQRFLLKIFLDLSLSNNRDEQRKAFCTTNKATLLLMARMQ